MATSRAATYNGTPLVTGNAEGAILASDIELSFFGGVDPVSGEIVDRHHPLSGQVLTDRILVIPGGRGSCSGSAVMLELLLNGRAPKALIFKRNEDILSLGVIVGEEMFGRSIPIVALGEEDFEAVKISDYAVINDGRVQIGKGTVLGTASNRHYRQKPEIELSDADKAILAGAGGKAMEVAMRIVTRMAQVQGAPHLIDVTQAHVDACIYTGPAALGFAEKMMAWGARVSIPTTLNAISVDRKRWRAQGIQESVGAPADRLADLYTQMGAQPTFTCAPYLLGQPPRYGANVAWSESNAVVFANSVLGARTMKYPDFLDLAVAMTGRAPLAGPYVEEHRRPEIIIEVPSITEADDSFFPVLGYTIGAIAGSRIPLLTGLARNSMNLDDLKSFGAAFATVSSAPMFHIVGVTPEAATSLKSLDNSSKPIERVRLNLSNLETEWRELNSATVAEVDLISLGNPHFSLTEIWRLASLCSEKTKSESVKVVVTTSRQIYDSARQEGLIAQLERFGVQFVTDTCWCMITEPIIPPQASTIMTNSGKYAHYGPGLTGRSFHFGSLVACVDAACSGKATLRTPNWLKTLP
ncbi:aconitase family protein [Rhizobium sp. 16-449-1b]|uniref:cis-3-hydroxy-L-proline dehydratase n=1 Tax=Rhizobium sp. 16-449-1b TaxID=2819989 RepID=UPI001ADB1E3F|nr:aconitase family protein [Rhizobium sp. 16-449-1b]MBO9195408.1 aconitase family protein [Rhizobium sp. 16-449-1b]